jgi:hypothetical protein
VLPTWIRVRWWPVEKGTGLVSDVLEVDEPAALADDIEEIAMLAGRGVGLMFNCT